MANIYDELMSAALAYPFEDLAGFGASNDNAPLCSAAVIKIPTAYRRDLKRAIDQSYTYDGNLKRVKSVVNGKTLYNVYDASGKLVHVEDQNPSDGGAVERTDYLSAGGMPIVRMTAGQAFIYEHSDHLGSPVATTSQTGAIISRERYTPFGETLDNPQILDNQGGFTGHIKDKATGLNYMQARYYDPVIGRFLSVDPVTFLDKPYPGQFNRYAYTWNDPINATDPNGEFLKIVKSVYNVGKRTYKNGGNLKGALKDEALSYVENGATILDPNASLGDKAFAVFDLATGFGEEAKGAKSLVKKLDSKASLPAPAKNRSTLFPGPNAGDSIPATSTGKATTAQQKQINQIGNSTGCHTCSSPTSGTTSGNWIGDHQPPSGLNPAGNQQRLFPHCDSCSRTQAGQVTQEIRRRKDN